MLDDLHKIRGVKAIHHLHLWTITSGINAMSAHVLIDDVLTSRSTHILKEIKTLLRENYNIEHSTIQFESELCSDDLAEDKAISCNSLSKKQRRT
jgi:cobalt-zinc-cadmium efflux system protein